MTFRLTDTVARIGVRRDPQNANRKQKIFGYNLVLSTSVELDLKLELPVSATNIAGNAEEGKKIITNTEQIRAHHDYQSKNAFFNSLLSIKRHSIFSANQNPAE